MYSMLFDVLYWSFGLVILAFLTAALIRAGRHVDAKDPGRQADVGIAAIAAGALLALVGGFGLNALRPVTGDLFYQQVHFGAFYVAFGMVLWGMLRVRTADLPISAPPGPWFGAAAWTTFLIATVGVGFELLRPDTYRVVSAGGDVRYVQEVSFFLPVFIALAAGAIGLLPLLDDARSSARRRAAWLVALAAFMSLGMLREATIVPSFDQPLLDLCAAFVPFTLAAICLYRAAAVSQRQGLLAAGRSQPA
jgi:hypothetical protein